MKPENPAEKAETHRGYEKKVPLLKHTIMVVFLKRRWVLLLTILIFIFFKIPHLCLPYYWDESWPYAAAVNEMYHHGISLLPGAIDGELSRGHPLFFHATAGLWMNIFGNSIFAMHSFALLISLLWLVAMYEAWMRLFNQRVAIIALLLVATQSIFFLHSSFLLPEILVGFLGFLSLYYYTKEQFVLTALCLTALFYTKESGLIMGAVIGTDALIGLFMTNKHLIFRLHRFLSVSVPVILALCFFLIQKRVMGWYILPLYSDIIEHSWDAFWYKFRMGCVRDTFYVCYRYWYFVVLMLLFIIAAIKNKKLWYLSILFPGAIIYYYVDDLRAGRILPSIPFFILFIFSLLLFLYALKKMSFFDREQQKFVILLCSFIFLYLCFSAMNYYIARYLFAAIISLLLLSAILFDKAITASYPVLFYPVTCIILLISCISLRRDTTDGEIRSCMDGLDVQQHVIDYMEANNYYDKSIRASFLEQQHLINPATGFLRFGKKFKNVKPELDSKTNISIFDNIELNGPYEEVKRGTDFQLVHRYQKGAIWAEIYLRK